MTAESGDFWNMSDSREQRRKQNERKKSNKKVLEGKQMENEQIKI